MSENQTRFDKWWKGFFAPYRYGTEETQSAKSFAMSGWVAGWDACAVMIQDNLRMLPALSNGNIKDLEAGYAHNKAENERLWALYVTVDDIFKDGDVVAGIKALREGIKRK